MATGRLGTTPVLRTRWSKEPAGGTTSLSGLDDYSVSLVYEVGYEAVYQNGALLSRGNDYTATNGTTITLTNATVAGDIIEVFANNVVPLTDTYSQSVADGKFVNNTIVDAKGDLIVGSAADTFTRLAVGSANQVLTVDSATTSGLKWATPASSQKNWTLLNAGGTSLTGATTITVSGISGADAIMVLVQSGSGATAGSFLSFRFNTDSNNNYYPAGLQAIAEGTYGPGFMRAVEGTATNEIRFTRMSNNAGGNCGAGLIVTGCNASGVKVFNATGSYYSSASNQDAQMYAVNGIYNSSSTISSVSVISSSGNWDNGTVFVYTTA